jgi:hypothetical protein
MKIQTKRGEASELLPLPVSLILLFLNSKLNAYQILTGNRSRACDEITQPHKCSGARSVTDTRNTPHLYKPLFRSVL